MVAEDMEYSINWKRYDQEQPEHNVTIPIWLNSKHEPRLVKTDNQGKTPYTFAYWANINPPSEHYIPY